MKKEKKERFKFLKSLREYWKIPRYRSFIILFLYFIFFVGVILYIKIMDSIDIVKDDRTPISAIYTFKTMDNYEYNYEIESIKANESLNYSISGIRFDNQDNFTVGEYDFYVQDNVIYSVNGLTDITDIVQIDLLLLQPDKIYGFLKNNTDANRVEYQNGEAKVTYTIPVSMFNITFLQGIPLENVDTVQIITYEENNQIYQIDMNILNLMKIVDSDLEKYTVKISYTNINNIKSVEEQSVQ